MRRKCYYRKLGTILHGVHAMGIHELITIGDIVWEPISTFFTRTLKLPPAHDFSAFLRPYSWITDNEDCPTSCIAVREENTTSCHRLLPVPPRRRSLGRDT